MTKVQPTNEKVQPNPTKGDKVWELIENVPISLFSLPPQKVSSLFTMVTTLDDAVILKLNSNATAAIAALDDTINSVASSSGDSKRVEKFDVKVTENGLVSVSLKKLK